MGRGRETHLLMYSPVRMTLQVWHLKQLTCHCLSRARSDWPCLISSLHPAQSEKTKGSRTSWVPLTSCRHPMPREPVHGGHFFPPRVATLVLPGPRDTTRQEERLPELRPGDKGSWSEEEGMSSPHCSPWPPFVQAFSRSSPSA